MALDTRIVGKCSSCRHYDSQSGTCRHDAPRMLGEIRREEPPMADPRGRVWPRVDEGDWCSRWQKQL